MFPLTHIRSWASSYEEKLVLDRFAWLNHACLHNDPLSKKQENEIYITANF